MRKQILQFKNFLSKDEVFLGDEEVFEKYLPYAVALGVETAWAGRFARINFSRPEWFDATDSVEGIDGFARSFLPIIDYISTTLSLSSEPLVK